MAGTRHTTKAPRARSCTKKKGFSVAWAAHAYRHWRIGQGAAEWTVGVYRCRFCGLLHVGHRPAERYRQTASR